MYTINIQVKWWKKTTLTGIEPSATSLYLCCQTLVLFATPQSTKSGHTYNTHTDHESINKKKQFQAHISREKWGLQTPAEEACTASGGRSMFIDRDVISSPGEKERATKKKVRVWCRVKSTTQYFIFLFVIHGHAEMLPSPHSSLPATTTSLCLCECACACV